MKALEFKSKIKNHRIQIPTRIQAEIKANSDKTVRVIVLIDENELSDDADFQNMATTQFLNGYSVSDSIYDK
jgi:hypothetical protein